MKRLIIFVFLCLNICNYIFASAAIPGPYLKIQPNGDSIYVYFRGDEYGAYYTDNKGMVIDKNEEGYWVYVSSENNKIVLTNQIVTSTSVPVNVNRKSVFNLISQKRMESRQKRLRYNSRSGQTQSVKLPSIGQPRVLTVLVQFQDIKFQSPTTINSYVSNLMKINSASTNTNSCVQGYFLDASYNKLNIESFVLGPYTVKHESSYYGKDGETDIDSLVVELVNEIIKEIIYDINLAIFDNDGDSLIECLHIVYAGEGQDSDKKISNLIWPHKGELIGGDSIGGFRISNYIVTPELLNGSYRGIGTICHELGHILGAPDFYDIKIEENDSFPGTGHWDLMASGDRNNNMNNPSMPNPYLKTEIFGWATAKELSGINVLDTLRPAELDSNSIYKLSTLTPNEYYLLENRQDTNLPGTGLVVYHVNAGIENHIDSNNINVTHRQNMYVVDANNHIVKPTGSVTSYGNINSPNATFRSTHSQNIYFTSESLPSNCDWDENLTQNKNVCFISEEEIDGETCILFVLNPEIEGPDILCDSAIYSLKHLPSNANIQWSYIRPQGTPLTSFPLFIGSGQGTKNVYFKRGNNILGAIVTPEPGEPILPVVPVSTSDIRTPYSGKVTIKADISLNNDTFTLTKDIYMPEKVIINDSLAGSQWRVGQNIRLSIKSPKNEIVNDNEIKWDIKIPGVASYTIYGKSISLTPPNIGTATITATYINGCNDEYMSQTKTYKVQYGMIPFYTNPVSGGSVEINVVNTTASDAVNGVQSIAMNQSEPYMGAYRLELWHDIYGKVREMDVPENTPTVTMNVDGLSSGIYILRLIIDNQLIQTSQMIIK